MKVSEKSLELNVGAEILGLMRNSWGMPKAYLRGLTQREERQEGVDFFVQLNPKAQIFAFQFKAPHGSQDAVPYKYTLVRYQHEPLFDLAKLSPRGVFYVLPYYVTVQKLQKDVPNLNLDTWLLPVAKMPTSQTFGSKQSKTVKCLGGIARINPEYRLESLDSVRGQMADGVHAVQFARWYERFRNLREGLKGRTNPWIARGMRIVIVQP